MHATRGRFIYRLSIDGVLVSTNEARPWPGERTRGPAVLVSAAPAAAHGFRRSLARETDDQASHSVSSEAPADPGLWITGALVVVASTVRSRSPRPGGSSCPTSTSARAGPSDRPGCLARGTVAVRPRHPSESRRRSCALRTRGRRRPRGRPRVRAADRRDRRRRDPCGGSVIPERERVERGRVGDPGPASGAEHAIVSGQPIRTPCWSYEGPEAFVNNVSTEEEERCHGALELWGEVVDGAVVPTGVGAVYGQVSVQPVRVATSEAWGSGPISGSGRPPRGLVLRGERQHPQPARGDHPRRCPGKHHPGPRNVRGDADEGLHHGLRTRAVHDGHRRGAVLRDRDRHPYDNGDELIDQVAGSWTWPDAAPRARGRRPRERQTLKYLASG